MERKSETRLRTVPKEAPLLVRAHRPGYRALALAVPDGFLWFWIGAHDEYERMLKDA